MPTVAGSSTLTRLALAVRRRAGARRLLAALMLASLFAKPAQAAVFDNPDAFYATRPGALFRPTDRFTPMPFIAPDERDRLTYYWEGKVGNQPHRVVGHGAQVTLDGVRFDLSRALPFPGDGPDVLSVPLEMSAESRVYLGSEYACVEIPVEARANVLPAPHGERQVVLLRLQPARARRPIRLPASVASCLGIWQTEPGTLAFYQARYRYQQGSPQPAGLTLTEFRLRQDRFEPRGKPVHAQFPVIGNTVRFSLPD